MQFRLFDCILFSVCASGAGRPVETNRGFMSSGESINKCRTRTVSLDRWRGGMLGSSRRVVMA
ncbi:MAG: hypothetical protein SFZ23_03590 [Planctomycetota bacterium]|nr:hypothetical protein [Planctomycetota bacterium]